MFNRTIHGNDPSLTFADLWNEAAVWYWTAAYSLADRFGWQTHYLNWYWRMCIRRSRRKLAMWALLNWEE